MLGFIIRTGEPIHRDFMGSDVPVLSTKNVSSDFVQCGIFEGFGMVLGQKPEGLSVNGFKGALLGFRLKKIVYKDNFDCCQVHSRELC